MQQPTQEQLDALHAYAAQYGRTWKSHLRHAWETGQYDGFQQDNFLQQVRNNLGPSWLVRFRFPKEVPVASWVIVNKATGKAVLETFNPNVVAKVNQEKYTAIPALQYLQQLNATIKAGGGRL